MNDRKASTIKLLLKTNFCINLGQVRNICKITTTTKEGNTKTNFGGNKFDTITECSL